MNSSAFGIRVAEEPGRVLVSLSGEVDYAASLDLTPTIDDIADSCESDLVFDLGDVTLLDSEGIKLLLKAFARMKEKHGQARIVRCSRIADRVIRLVGLDQVLEVRAG